MEIINNKIIPELSNEESSSYHGRIDAILHQINRIQKTQARFWIWIIELYCSVMGEWS